MTMKSFQIENNIRFSIEKNNVILINWFNNEELNHFEVVGKEYMNEHIKNKIITIPEGEYIDVFMYNESNKCILVRFSTQNGLINWTKINEQIDGVIFFYN